MEAKPLFSTYLVQSILVPAEVFVSASHRSFIYELLYSSTWNYYQRVIVRWLPRRCSFGKNWWTCLKASTLTCTPARIHIHTSTRPHIHVDIYTRTYTYTERTHRDNTLTHVITRSRSWRKYCQDQLPVLLDNWFIDFLFFKKKKLFCLFVKCWFLHALAIHFCYREYSHINSCTENTWRIQSCPQSHTCARAHTHTHTHTHSENTLTSTFMHTYNIEDALWTQ